MNAPEKPLPDDVSTLQEMVHLLLEEKQRLERRNTILMEQIRLYLAQRFGRSSEKRFPDHPSLFDEAELESTTHPESAEQEEEAGVNAGVAVAAHTRQKKGRKPLPDFLPRVEVIHDLPPEEKSCDLDGAALVEIGREISEQLDIIPAQFQVLRHIRIKYGCPHCHEGIKTAPLPPQPIPKSQASPGLLAYVSTAKPEAWQKVEALIAARKPGDYDQAVALLVDLRDVATSAGRKGLFDNRLSAIRQDHARKPSFIERLDNAGLKGV